MQDFAAASLCVGAGFGPKAQAEEFQQETEMLGEFVIEYKAFLLHSKLVFTNPHRR